MKEENKNNKKSYLIFAVIAIILLLLYNSFIIPAIKKAQIKDTNYSFFLKQVDAGTVSQVQIKEDTILFQVTGANGSKQLYSTIRIDDPNLVSKL